MRFSNILLSFYNLNPNPNKYSTFFIVVSYKRAAFLFSRNFSKLLVAAPTPQIGTNTKLDGLHGGFKVDEIIVFVAVSAISSNRPLPFRSNFLQSLLSEYWRIWPCAVKFIWLTLLSSLNYQNKIHKPEVPFWVAILMVVAAMVVVTLCSMLFHFVTLILKEKWKIFHVNFMQICLHRKSLYSYSLDYLHVFLDFLAWTKMTCLINRFSVFVHQ